MIKHYRNAFTVVELVVVVVVIAIIASITVVAYTTVQRDARDTSRIAKVQDIADALELYYLNNGRYPQIRHGLGNETSGCVSGDTSVNWGHCNRLKELTDQIAPYMNVDPTSLSQGTQGNYFYSYASQGGVDNWQTYGLVVFLEGDKGANDGGIYANGYEVGENPKYCATAYTGGNNEWLNKPADYDRRCQGGN